MSEAEYAILDHLESVCRELRTMIRTTEKGALQDVQLGDLVSCLYTCLLYTSPSPRDPKTSRMPSSA